MILFPAVRTLLAESSYQRSFEQRVRALALDLWAGRMPRYMFEHEMYSLIGTGLERAWEQGFGDMNIRPNEMDTADRMTISLGIMQQQAFLYRYSLWIEDNNRASGGERSAILNRAKLWSKLYNDYRIQARIAAGENEKLIWIYGDTQHCAKCFALNGKVKRAKYWRASGIHPQNPPNAHLDCGGWRCKCQLRRTNKPCSQGLLPGEKK